MHGRARRIETPCTDPGPARPGSRYGRRTEALASPRQSMPRRPTRPPASRRTHAGGRACDAPRMRPHLPGGRVGERGEDRPQACCIHGRARRIETPGTDPSPPRPGSQYGRRTEAPASQRQSMPRRPTRPPASRRTHAGDRARDALRMRPHLPGGRVGERGEDRPQACCIHGRARRIETPGTDPRPARPGSRYGRRTEAPASQRQ